jgi:diguanylate cyclase (GGDEF)-like protein
MSEPAARWPQWLKGLALAIAWVGVWGLGHLGEFATHASLWYPPAALTFASLAVLGARVIPFLVLASFGGTLWSLSIYQVEMHWTTVLWFGLANAAAHIGCYALGAFVLRRLAREQGHRLPNQIIAFLVVATLSSALATSGVISTLFVFGQLGPEGPWATALVFWIGDFVALVVLAPLFGAVLLRLLPRSALWTEAHAFLHRERLAGAVGYKLLYTIVLVVLVMLIANRVQSYESAFLVFFVLIPQLWLTYTESPLATTVSLAVVSFVVVLLLWLLDLGQFVYVYQLAIAIIATTAYFGLAIPLLEAANRQLRQRLMFDPLTGAATRDYLLEKMNLAQRATEGSTNALAIVDLDRFKQINDTYGHRLGDQALIALVETLRAHVRAGDVVARFGGDEFMLLLPGCDHDGARTRMEAAIRALREVRIGDDVRLTASVGIAIHRPDEPFDSWFARADEALYRAKQAGRDRVV